MKTHFLVLTAVIALTLYESQTAIAQWSPLYGSVTQGMFGPRVIGRSSSGTATIGIFGNRYIGSQVVQGPGAFTSNIQISPYGGFVYNNPSYGYQIVTPNTVSGPWYENNMLAYPYGPELPYGPTPESYMGEAIGPTMQGNSAYPGALPENTNFGPVPAGTTPGAVQQGANNGNMQQGTIPGNMQQGANNGNMQQGTNPGTAAAGVSIATPQRAKFYTASVLSARRQPFSRSTELSNRLTLIARDRGMLVGKGINVYLSNDIALVQGTVHTPADSAALASVLGLEPAVEHVDNRLSVGAAGN